MKKTFPVFFLLLSALGVFAQNIELVNPSFEGTPFMGGLRDFPLRGWLDCGFEGETAPDVQPGEFDPIFSVTQKAFSGKTYLGMVTRDNETWEKVSQRLSSPLEGGKCYEFSIYLCRSPVYISMSASARAKGEEVEVNYTTPIKLRIWGGVGPCARTELLAESILVKNTRWLRFDFTFHPNHTLSYITLEAFYNTPVIFPYNGNILVDSASAIVEVPCDEEIPVIADVSPPPPPVDPQEIPSTKEETPSLETKGAFSRLEVEKLSVGTTLRIDKLYFHADSANFTPDSKPILDDIYLFLTENPKITIEVGGHTNGIPSHAYCDKLSTARAKAVADYLIAKGIEPSRVKYKGYGKRRPIATNKTPEGRKKNQRVEITILSKGRH